MMFQKNPFYCWELKEFLLRVRPHGSVITSSGSVLGWVVGFFASWELFHGIYGLVVSAFHCRFSMLCLVLFSEEVPALCWPQVRGGSPVMSLFIYVVHGNSSTPDTGGSGIKVKLKNKNKIFSKYSDKNIVQVIFVFSWNYMLKHHKTHAHPMIKIRINSSLLHKRQWNCFI